MNREEINARLKRIDIQGKPYVEVVQRVQGFWALYPDGSIETEFVVLQREWCVCRATLRDGNGKVIATGTADESRDDGRINKTSMVENCETSAVGRACGMAGIGSVESMASADEVANAIAQQERQKPKPKPKDELTAIYNECVANGVPADIIRSTLVAAFGDKATKDYTPKERAKAALLLLDLYETAKEQAARNE